MRRSDFSYELPPDLIAQVPGPRGGSRMLVVDPRNGTMKHERFEAFVDEQAERRTPVVSARAGERVRRMDID